jgi:uracil-DNA glycosylase
MRLTQLMSEARACTVCASELADGCRPLIQGSARARVLIIGQAPGSAAHASGIPWDDRSGARLREWLGVTDDEFYDASRVALMPMGFCYPGTGRSGDLRPRGECAPLWHDRLLAGFKGVELTVYAGRYAFERYLSDGYASLTDAVRDCDGLLPTRVALPHPSPRNNLWLSKHPWFEEEVVPALRRRVRGLMG